MKNDDNFWKTLQGKALIKLGLWGIFFALIFIVASFSSSNVGNIEASDKTLDNNLDSNKEEVARFTLYEDMINNILKNNYEFSYDIMVGEEKYLFSGKNDGINVAGIKETKEEILKYFVSEGVFYKVKLDELELIENVYLGIDEEIIDLNKLFTFLKDISYRVEKIGDTREIIYNDASFKLVVKTDLEEIIEINYSKENVIYNMKFMNIGKIGEIKYELQTNEEDNLG